jgi:RNA polymerase sigma-70 factor (ECF subfamily)
MRQLAPDELSSELERHYKYYQQRLMRRLVNLGHGKERAEDYCQDTFLRAWKHIQLQDTKLPETDYYLDNWLRKIAENIAYDDYRHNKRVSRQPLPDDETHSQVPELTTEGIEEWRYDKLMLQEEWPKLPTRVRACLWLEMRGLKQKDIAAELGITPSTVSEILRDVKTQLQQKIYPVTFDIRLAEAKHAGIAMKDLLRGLNGVVIDDEKFGEHCEKSLDWQYRRYMRKHMSELRDGLINDSDFFVSIVEAEYGKNLWYADKPIENGVPTLRFMNREFYGEIWEEIRRRADQIVDTNSTVDQIVATNLPLWLRGY